MKKFNKKEIIKIILILIACFAIFSQYYLEHYVTDAYKEAYLGTSYLSQLKLIEGRPIQSLYFFILNKIGINLSTLKEYLLIYRINLTLSIILISFAILITNQIILKIINTNNKKYKILILLIISTFFINLSINEYLLFIENYIMILGIILTIFSSLVFVKSSKKSKYAISLILLLIASFCYQGTITIFMPFTYLLCLLSKNKNSTKNLLKIVIIYGIILILNFLVIRYFYNILPKYDNRLQENINLINNVLEILYTIFINFTLLSCVTFFIVVMSNIKILNIKNILIILILVLITITSYTCFRLGNTAVLANRLILSLNWLLGIIYIYVIFLHKNISNKKYIILYLCFVIYLLLSIIALIYLQRLHINSTKKNQQVIYQIINKIDNYETLTGTKIDKVAFYIDKYPNFSKYYNCFGNELDVYTFPLLYYDWSDDIYCINILGERHFKRANTSELDHKVYDYFKENNWDDLNLEEQIIFNDNVINICFF